MHENLCSRKRECLLMYFVGSSGGCGGGGACCRECMHLFSIVYTPHIHNDIE